MFYLQQELRGNLIWIRKWTKTCFPLPLISSKVCAYTPHVFKIDISFTMRKAIAQGRRIHARWPPVAWLLEGEMFQSCPPCFLKLVTVTTSPERPKNMLKCDMDQNFTMMNLFLDWQVLFESSSSPPRFFWIIPLLLIISQCLNQYYQHPKKGRKKMITN